MKTVFTNPTKVSCEANHHQEIIIRTKVDSLHLSTLSRYLPTSSRGVMTTIEMNESQAKELYKVLGAAIKTLSANGTR